ncbi:MAG: MBL fold metallo-hydrolase [Ignavibacteria bacterium]|nr:MBL fold metallo-hydrolase [Ignavibacteria bacterium]NNJ51546.1 MBL fold metallo-hydrolase [Ignavibacteriaceae bacterium]
MACTKNTVIVFIGSALVAMPLCIEKMVPMHKKFIAILFILIFIPSCGEFNVSLQSIKNTNDYALSSIILERTKTNVYIISNKKKECIIIDPAYNIKQIAKTLQNRNFKLKAIFLTHNHWDHSLEIIELSDMLSIPIITNDKQIEMGNTLVGTVLKSKRMVKVVDRQVINFAGIHIQIIFTPGHSKGSMCFYHKVSNSLFSGDTIFKGSIGRSDFEGSEEHKIIDSIYSVLKIIKNSTAIYPGHGEKTTKLYELSNNPFLNSAN